jgi:shikimate dehydrogenase
VHVRATTKVYGIFGHPVSHSLSPIMHNAAFKKLKLDCVYIAFDIHPTNLDSATQAIKSLGILGVNVTIPHKERIISFLDEISPEGTLTGAVNTVKNEDGKLTDTTLT